MSETKILPLLTWRSAICDSGMPPATRHIALALSLYMNERGGSAFPGADRLAHDTGLNVSTVRERLQDLVKAGWLELVEKGGQRGAKKTANAYQARVPLVSGDPSSGATRRLRRADPSSQALLPLVSGEAISSLNSSENSSGHTAASGGPDERIQKLVAGYVDDYAYERSGHHPSVRWRGAAGKAAKTALDDGEDVEDIARCFGVIAHEGKNPSALPHVLSDYHANRPRRMP